MVTCRFFGQKFWQTGGLKQKREAVRSPKSQVFNSRRENHMYAYTMLHTKFQGHWSIGSGEEDFLRFLPYMGMGAMLVM